MLILLLIILYQYYYYRRRRLLLLPTTTTIASGEVDRGHGEKADQDDAAHKGFLAEKPERQLVHSDVDDAAR